MRSTPILLVLLTAAVAHADEAELSIASPAIAAHSSFSVTTTTTIVRGSGKTAKKAVRTETETVALTYDADKKRVTRADFKIGAPTTTGTWPTRAYSALTNNENITEFTYKPTAAAGEQIVFDAGDGITANDDWETPLVARIAWVKHLSPLRPLLVGKTFTPGTTVELGGNELDLTLGGLDATLSGSSMTYQKLDGGVATFSFASSMQIVMSGGTTMLVPLTGTLSVDPTTARVTKLTVSGAIGEGSSDVVRVSQSEVVSY